MGSRDAARGAGYCSSICCMSATKEAMVALEHAHGRKLEISIFCMDVRAFGKEFDSYVNRARDEHGVKFIRAIPSRIVEMPGSRTPRIRYFDQDGAEQQQDFDLVVLSVGLRPSAGVKEMAAQLGVELNEFGFSRTERLSPLATSKPGIYVAGAFQEPKDIPESVAQASARRRLRHGPARPFPRHHDPAPRISLGARHHRRIPARGRVHLPLRPQHRFGRRRETGGRARPPAWPTSATPKPTCTPARIPTSSTSRT